MANGTTRQMTVQNWTGCYDNPDADDFTEGTATRWGNLELALKQYLEEGNTNSLPRILRCLNVSFLSARHSPTRETIGRYLLARAIERNDVDLVTQLIRHGADVTESHRGQTVLHLAVSLGDIPIVERLVDTGASLYQLDRRGNSLIFTALDSSSPNKVCLFHSFCNIQLNNFFS